MDQPVSPGQLKWAGVEFINCKIPQTWKGEVMGGGGRAVSE